MGRGANGMALDIAGLVAPLTDEAPSGPDLSYDNERVEIESVFERSVSTESSGAGDETDWRATIRLITGQAERTRDLWLPVYLMRAAAQAGQMDSVCDGAELLAALLEQRWDDVHPQLDEYGFVGRKSPCESLTRLGDFLNPLGRLTLIEHSRLGSYSGADFERFQEQGTNADNYGMFRALIDATPAEELQALIDRIDGLRNAIRRADSVLTAHAEDDTSTNFQPTYDAIEKMRRAVASVLPSSSDSGAGEATSGPASGGGGGPAKPGSGGGGQGFSGGVNSREDVTRALDAICAYYARSEPASPVPFALRRAREWISLDFMAVLEDIAPGSLDEARRVLKSVREKQTGQADSDWTEPESTSTTSDDSWN